MDNSRKMRLLLPKAKNIEIWFGTFAKNVSQGIRLKWTPGNFGERFVSQQDGNFTKMKNGRIWRAFWVRNRMRI